MRSGLLRDINILTPKVVAPADASSFARMAQAFNTAGDESFNKTVNIADPNTLEEGWKKIADAMKDAWPDDASSCVMLDFVRKSFDVMCAAFRLTDQDMPSLASLYATLIIQRYSYGDAAKYAQPHFEFGCPHESGYMCDYRLASFVVASFPFGTTYYDPVLYPFEGQSSREGMMPAGMSPSLAWSQYSGCIPHGAPALPKSYKEAKAMAGSDLDPEIVDLFIRPDSLLRIVAHAGLRTRHQTVRVNTRGVGVIKVGDDITPNVRRVLFPRYALTKAA